MVGTGRGRGAAAAADWLERRPQLGREVFARERPGAAAGWAGGGDGSPSSVPAVVGDLTALFRACLVALRLPDEAVAWRPPRPPLWRVSDARARIGRLLEETPGAARELGALLPRLNRAASERELRCRAAVASTLLAGLQMAREGLVGFEQDGPGQAILVVRTGEWRQNDRADASGSSGLQR